MAIEGKLTGEVALVTGGSRGIGRACALELAKHGAEVVVNFVSNEDKARSVCQEIESLGGKATALRFDVGNAAETQGALEGLLKEKKCVSIVVNNAGIAKDGLLMRYALEDWDQVVQTNLKGAFVVTQALLRPMLKERKGSIIHMSSIVGVNGNPGQAAYCAAKAGIIGLTKSMAKELASRNIRVNAVAPGYIETDMTDHLTAEQKELFLKTIPLARPGKAEEVAQVVRFLASPDSNYITGQVILVDGGMGM